MTADKFFDESAHSDPTWKKAQQIAQMQLHIPSHLWSLFRSAWSDSLTLADFVHQLGFTRTNLACLLTAANVEREIGESDVDLLKRAVEILGIPLSAVVLAINHTCAMVLKTNPPPIWRPIFEQMMACIEIGAKMGARVASLSTAGGALIGFSRGAGLSLLLAHNAKEYRRWHSLSNGFESRETLLPIFGCEAYQVAAFAVQQLGFGAEVAMGTAIATGQLNPTHLNLGPEVMKWKAAFQWIDALREGRGFPADPALRSFFTELTPPRDPSRKNTLLEVLYTEVARVKRQGSTWMWHLPKPSYEDTLAMIKA